ncbi:MAG: GMC family oxidoreductase [Saprospiraceae bacterium]|nr:GMC family oxidoreductase [Saprospiraceae bacterium]MBP9209731.1 GMC family oxidoreductase [Saprospiraceae bacterium]
MQKQVKQAQSEVHCDYLVIGSGFGGSVAAMRLAEKGYQVVVLEQGKRWNAEDFPKCNWNLRRHLWLPRLGWKGILSMQVFRNLFVVSGVGVGGGSLVYANAHMTPDAGFFEHPCWAHLGDWKTRLEPHYRMARTMLGSERFEEEFPEDLALREIAREAGRESSYGPVDAVGVYLKGPDGDPYFGGLGPVRKACVQCAGCMVGCRHHAKNTLDKNYLWLAERVFGARIHPETRAESIARNPEGGYRVLACKLNHSKKGGEVEYYCKAVVVSAGVVGTVKLLMRQKHVLNTLPDISDRLGDHVLTNSEMICGVTAAKRKLNHGIAISTAYRPDGQTCVELCKYPNGSGALFFLATMAASGSTASRRLFNWAGQIVLHPLRWARSWFQSDRAQTSILLLVMQNLPGSMQFRWKSGWFGKRLQLINHTVAGVRPFIPEGQHVMDAYAKKVDGVAQNAATEIFLGKATTAHLLGGCPMGEDAKSGVVSDAFEVHGYPGLYVLDGSIVPANPGVNPSLTITALSEFAMSLIPPHPQASGPVLEVLLRERTLDKGI